MLIYPEINPVAIKLGSLSIHWYGITYLVAFGLFVFLGRLRLKHLPFRQLTPIQENSDPIDQQPKRAKDKKRQKDKDKKDSTKSNNDAGSGWCTRDVEDILFNGVLGVILGGRLGYCLFYKPVYFFQHPLEIFQIWQGGMSFHGGMLGVILAMVWFAYSRKRHWLEVTDFIAPCVPTGLAAGRIGNFINGELWGRFADPQLPWAMVFPHSGSSLPRHPSQIYQFLLEGLLLFVILWLYARSPRRLGEVSAVFLMGYGALRFIAEYFREPDHYLGLLSLGMSMGQWLCVPMIAFGVGLFIWARKNQAGLRPLSR